MTTLLFNLTNVPEDEAQEVRQLLAEGGFAVYETDAGRWRSGVAGIWLADDQQLAAAREAIDEYQKERAQRVRQEYLEQEAAGQAPNLWGKLKQQPIQVVACCAVIGVIAALMVLPFIGGFL
jgi:uncharacterized protein YaaQ